MNTLTWRSRVPVSKTRFGHWKQIATLWYEYTMYYRCTCIIYIFSKCLMLIFLSCPIPRSIDIVLTYYHIQLEYSTTKLILNDIINQTFYSHTLFGQKEYVVCSGGGILYNWSHCLPYTTIQRIMRTCLLNYVNSHHGKIMQLLLVMHWHVFDQLTALTCSFACLIYGRTSENCFYTILFSVEFPEQIVSLLY